MSDHIPERESAIALAHYILDRTNADPDDDYAVLARQFLRECERRQAEHDAALERAAMLCDNYKPPINKLCQGLQTDDEFEAMKSEIRAEQRGENIASEIIAGEIRALKESK